MIFTKYRSMENSYRTAFICKIIQEGFASSATKWVATEKIHGVNCGLWTDGKEIKISRKTDFVKDDEHFYNAHKILTKYKKDILTIFNTMKIISHSIKHICIWGELYGGIYPHPDVTCDNNSTQVQKGLFYNPSNDFLVYDITENDQDFNELYIDFDWVIRLTAMTQLKMVPELARGTFAELIKFPNDGLSEVYKMFNLPPIEDNIMEGVVLKPIISHLFKNGDRVIVKNKNERWKEKANAPKHKREPLKINKTISPIMDELSLYITENRLHNVLSHIGKITQKDFGIVNKEFIADVMKDYFLDNGNQIIDSLKKEDRKILNKMLNKQTTNLIKKNFINIIDGNY